MKGLVGLVAGACMALAIACAASVAPMAVAPQMAPASGSSSHDQIQELANQLDAKRVELKLPEQHGVTNGATSMGNTPEIPACARAQSDTCTQTCTLSDSICDNSKKICELADQLAGDAWAAQKCADGKATCTAATQRCCECTP
jgi:uncharacterized protein with beta-barrel porin domain